MSEIEFRDLSLKFTEISENSQAWGAFGPIDEPTVSCTVTNVEGVSWLDASKPKAEIDMIEAMREARERLGDDALVERILAAANGMADYARAEENSNHERF